MNPGPRVGGATLTLVPDGEPGGRARGVGGQLDEEEPGGAEQAFVGEVLHLVGVVQSGGVQAVPVPDQQPEKNKRLASGDAVWVQRAAGSAGGRLTSDHKDSLASRLTSCLETLAYFLHRSANRKLHWIDPAVGAGSSLRPRPRNHPTSVTLPRCGAWTGCRIDLSANFPPAALPLGSL